MVIDGYQQLLVVISSLNHIMLTGAYDADHTMEQGACIDRAIA